MGELHRGRVGGFVPLLVVLLLGAAGWEVGEAGEELMMGQVERQLSAGWLECGGDSKGAGCFSDEEEEFALDSETNRMLQSGAAYLSNLLLKKDGVPCQIPGRSYTSCGSPARREEAKLGDSGGWCSVNSKCKVKAVPNCLFKIE